MKTKKGMITIILCVLILTIGGLFFKKIHQNHQINQQIIKECFEHFDKETAITIKKESYWSPVVCEKK